MRTGLTANGGCSPVGTLCTPSATRPLSATTRWRIGVDSAVAGTRKLPAGYDLSFALNGAAARDTDCFALSSRFTATNASLTLALMMYAPPVGAVVTFLVVTGVRV